MTQLRFYQNRGLFPGPYKSTGFSKTVVVEFYKTIVFDGFVSSEKTTVNLLRF